MTPAAKRVLVGCGVLGGGGILAVLAFVSFVFVIQPRRVLAKYDRFVDSYPAGASIDSLVSDPFVRDATLVMVDGKPLPGGGSRPKTDELRAQVSAHPDGELLILWTHTPPFGRVSVTVVHSGGKVLSLRRGALD